MGYSKINFIIVYIVLVKLMIPTLLTGEFGQMQFVIAIKNPPIPILLPILQMKQCDKTKPSVISINIITTPSNGDIAKITPLARILGIFIIM